MDKMGKLEKLALTSAVSGAVFNVFLYGIGATLAKASEGSDLYTIRIIAAILQAAAFDLVAIATVMGMRSGRRGPWSMGTAVASALVSAAIALDVAGVLSMPWLHAANALIVLAFTLHLLTPPKEKRAPQLRRLVKKLCGQIRQERQLSDFNLNTLRTASEQMVSRLEQDRAALEQMLATTRQELSSRHTPIEVEVVRVARYQLTLEQMATLANTSVSTIRRRLPELADKGGN